MMRIALVALVFLGLSQPLMACDSPGEPHCDETYQEYYQRLQNRVMRQYPHHQRRNQHDDDDDPAGDE